jgi:signal-transduction protein with cAMP-binding, CBS, and nucleotidyltransferase domain
MLNISHVNVVRKGIIKGVITKNEFLEKKKAEDNEK